MTGGADLERALQHYRDLAPRYDAATRRIDAIRQRAIATLALQPGETVVDAACGTGWSIPRLAAAVGAEGRVIAFDPSAEMLAIARTRAATAPVELIQAEGCEVRLPEGADAILFSYAHDLIQSREALDHVLGQMPPGARVAATSTKLFARWLFPANWYLRWSHRGYITDCRGLAAPWSLLAERLDEFRVETGPFTQHYIARGRVRGRPQAA